MRRQREILAEVKRLAAEYYRVTGKPLGVTGEIAEFAASEKLGLDLADARTAGYDATRQVNGREELVQIKGRRRTNGSLCCHRSRHGSPPLRATVDLDRRANLPKPEGGGIR